MLSTEADGAHLVVEGKASRVRDRAAPERASAAFQQIYGWPTTVAGDQLDADPTGTMLAVGHTTGTVTLSSLTDGRLLRTLTGHSAAVGAIAFSPDGQLIASLGDDNAVNVTNLVTHLVLGRLTGHTGPVTAATFTEDNHALYTSSANGTVIGWDVAT